MTRSSPSLVGICSGAVAALVLAAGNARSTTVLDSVSSSPDVDVVLSSTPLADEDVGVDGLAGVVTPASLGSIPTSAAVTGYHPLVNGDLWLSFDTTLDLPGGIKAAPGDVVRYDGVNYFLPLDASAAGVPPGVVADAVSRVGSDHILVSFDVSVTLGSVTAHDEDLLRYDGGTFTLFFDGSAEGVPAALDLDAAHYAESEGLYFLSFDTSGSVGGVDFDDEDVLEYDGAGGWSLAFDASAEHAAWSAADLDAVAVALPEPGALPTLIAAIPLLRWLGRRRIR